MSPPADRQLDGADHVGKEDPDRAYNEAMREVFGGDEVLFVLISGHEVFTPDGMARLAATRRALRRVSGVERVLSLDDVRVVSGSADAVDVRTFVPARNYVPRIDA